MPYEPYRLVEVRTQFFQIRTEQSSSHCANLIVTLPQETFPLEEFSKSPLHFATHRDESVIMDYYTSKEVHLRSPSPLDEPRKEGCPWQEMMVLTAPVSETLQIWTHSTPSSALHPAQSTRRFLSGIECSPVQRVQCPGVWAVCLALHGTPWYLARPALLPALRRRSGCAGVDSGTPAGYTASGVPRPVSPSTTEKIKKTHSSFTKRHPSDCASLQKFPKI